MENLNDVEFGSDKEKEEAPILVAQRYLNIYRQVHIFNKAKRDQFDDELLALPPVITDFYKRMPGGRLLMEHIEEVKTERGISFVKSNKEDYTNLATDSSTPSGAPAGAPVSGAVVAGSVTIDSSFAETLAQSLAAAFKQNPMQATVSGGGATGGVVDFGNTFDVIAEEIRTSRASLLDVLKETRNITDSVIASQVSISRILEGILASRSRDDIGKADLNNRIIASQASITKLLEGMYTSNAQKNNEISDFLNIENRLQSFKNEIRAEVESSLNRMQQMLVESFKDIAAIGIQTSGISNAQQNNFANSNVNDRSQTSASTEKTSLQTQVSEQIKSQPSAIKAANFVDHCKELIANQLSTFEQEENFKKKKKKKKNRFEDGLENNNRDNVSSNIGLSVQQPQINRNNVETTNTPIRTNSTSTNTPNTVQQKPFVQNNNLGNNTNNNAPQKTFVQNNGSTNTPNNNEQKPQNSITNSAQARPREALASVSAPIAFAELSEKAFNQEDDFDNFIIDKPLAVENTPNTNTSRNDYREESFVDDLDFVLPQSNDVQPTKAQTFSPVYDGLDFALPKHAFAEDANSSALSDEELNVDLSSISDDLNYNLPPQGSALRDDTPQLNITSASFEDDGLSFSLPESNTFEQKTNLTYNETPNFNEEASSGNNLQDLSKINDLSLNTENQNYDFDYSSFENASFNDTTTEATSETPSFSNNQPEFNDLASFASSNNIPNDGVIFNSGIEDTFENSFTETTDSALGQDVSFETFDFNSFENNTESSNEHPFVSSETEETNLKLDDFLGLSQEAGDLNNQNTDENNSSNNESFSSFDDNFGNSDATPSFEDNFNNNDFVPSFENGFDNNESVPNFEDNFNNNEFTPSFENSFENNETVSTFENPEQNETPSVGLNEFFLDQNNEINSLTIEPSTPKQSRYSAELDKIRAALTTDNIDISSLDKPIALDDYSDDENVPSDNSYDEQFEDDNFLSIQQEQPNSTTQEATSDDDWEWEWVDENGNPVSGNNGGEEDWEWVDENGNPIKNDNNGN